MRKNNCCHHIVLLMGLIFCSLCAKAQYFDSQHAPKPVEFMQFPQDETSVMWAADYYRHVQLMAQRDSSRITTFKYANYESSMTYIYYYFRDAFGFTPKVSTSIINNNYLDYLLNSSQTSTSYSIASIPAIYNITRPYVLLNEKNFAMPYSASTYERNISTSAPKHSFPSKFSTIAWETGVLMAATNPWNANNIIQCSYQYGLDRTISGAMWQSHADASRVIGMSCVARLYAEPRFRQELRLARNYMRDTLKTADVAVPSMYVLAEDDATLNLLTQMMPAPFDLSSPAMQSDLSHFTCQQSLRDSIAATDSIMSESFPDPENAIDQLQKLLDISITPEDCPTLHSWITCINSATLKACQLAQNRFERRERPFEIFHVSPLTYENTAELKQKNSYPSTHAATGWAVSLALAMLCPEQQNQLLKAGYDYGEHRVLAGTNWHSDVEAGRIIACLTLSRLLASEDFLEELEQSIHEYHDLTSRVITDNPVIKSESDAKDKTMFTIDGRQATPNSKGILVGKGSKILVR